METNPLAHASDFALLLGSRANRLADLGQPDQSIACLEETIEIYRELSGINPGELPRSGTALHNLAAVLAESGRHGNALAPLEEAVDIRRQLAARHPEAHLPALAGSLSTLGRVLSDVDRHTDAIRPARQAVAISRSGVESNPQAYRPILATVGLNSSAIHVVPWACELSNGFSLAAAVPQLRPPVGERLESRCVGDPNQIGAVAPRGVDVLLAAGG